MNLRTITLSLIFLVVLSIAIAAYQGKSQSKTGPFSRNTVTVEMLDKARANAQTNHKLLMVEFGADWCSDCVQLSKALEEGALRDYLKAHVVVLTVDVGQFNRNIDIAKSLNIDIKLIPTVVFLPPDGGVPAKRVGSNQILAYLKDLVERQ